MKILFITNTPPIPTQGGAMTFYRHFVQRTDFEIAVVTNDQSIRSYELPYKYMVINEGTLGRRISSTRFHRLVQTYRRLVGIHSIHPEILKFSEEFQPDAIFTVGGSWNWVAILAQKIARKLNKPLIGSFNDWWTYCSTYHPSFSTLIDKKFKSFYQSCDLAICTSEGMRQELGDHPNATILYPTGAKLDKKVVYIPSKDTFEIAFAGNLGEWYGTMLESIITNAKDKHITFKLYGFNPNWSADFQQYVLENNIYQGKVSFTELQSKIASADALLLLMGFDEDSKMVEKTSFKTKFLDYIAFQKPILLWGPEYCSAVQTAREFDSAQICSSADILDFVRVIDDFKKDDRRKVELVENSFKMYSERFNPDTIHFNLVRAIKNTLV